MFVPRRYLALLFVIAICGTLQVCFVHAAEHPIALIEYPNASEVSYSKVGSTDQVSYHVQEKFPGSHVIGFIASGLRKAGWTASSMDFMNPDSDPSVLRKWTESIDGRKGPYMCVQSWIGQWKDGSGNIVEYIYRYQSPIHDRDPLCTGDTSTLTDLKVDGIYWTASAVQQTVQIFEKWEKDHGCTKKDGVLHCQEGIATFGHTTTH